MFKLALFLTLLAYVVCGPDYDLTKFNEYYCLGDKMTEAERMEYNKCENIWPERELKTIRECRPESQDKPKLLGCYLTLEKYSEKLLRCYQDDVDKNSDAHASGDELRSYLIQFMKCAYFLKHAH